MPNERPCIAIYLSLQSAPVFAAWLRLFVLVKTSNPGGGMFQDLVADGRPVYREADRLEILSELACVDYLTVFDEPTAHGLLDAVRPDVYVKGGDYRPEEINEHALAGQLGIELRMSFFELFRLVERLEINGRETAELVTELVDLLLELVA